MSDIWTPTRWGYAPMDPDDADPPQQPRCTCGAMLSWTPTVDEKTEVKVPRWHVEYIEIPGSESEVWVDEMGPPLLNYEYIETFVDDGFDVEYEYRIEWHCKRCGAVLDESEIR